MWSHHQYFQSCCMEWPRTSRQMSSVCPLMHSRINICDCQHIRLLVRGIPFLALLLERRRSKLGLDLQEHPCGQFICLGTCSSGFLYPLNSSDKMACRKVINSKCKFFFFFFNTMPFILWSRPFLCYIDCLALKCFMMFYKITITNIILSTLQNIVLKLIHSCMLSNPHWAMGSLAFYLHPVGFHPVQHPVHFFISILLSFILFILFPSI